MSDLLSRLEPELAAVFDSVPAVDLDQLDVARASLIARSAGRTHRDDVERRDRWIPGAGDGAEVLVREYRPSGVGARAATDSPCLVWVHGGGFVMGTIDQSDVFLEALVAELGCVAVSIEWRQAPEHPYPAAHDDCFAAVRWVLAGAQELGIDPSRVALAGGSCGGGLVASVVLRLRDEGLPLPCLQLLIYPMLDDRSDSASWRRTTDPRVWNLAGNRSGWRAYLSGITGEVPASAAPARATELRGLPPTFLAVGDLDGLLDEDLDFARRLMAAGVPTELHVYPGMIHGFNSGALPTPRTSQYVADRNRALRIAFAR